MDAIGALLILAVALLVAIGPSGISPSQIGLLLTYTVSLVQMCVSLRFGHVPPR